MNLELMFPSLGPHSDRDPYRVSKRFRDVASGFPALREFDVFASILSFIPTFRRDYYDVADFSCAYHSVAVISPSRARKRKQAFSSLALLGDNFPLVHEISHGSRIVLFLTSI